jgi:hypothetical protein
MTPWKKDLDLLIEQTMSFVRSVAATNPQKSTTIESPIRGESPAAVAQSILVESSAPESAQPIRLAAETLSSKPAATERDEIQRRVASFKAHQDKLQREREDYYLSVIAKTRAMIGNETPSPPLK